MRCINTVARNKPKSDKQFWAARTQGVKYSNKLQFIKEYHNDFCTTFEQ